MFSKAEKSEHRKTFWTAFGRFMNKHRSAEGRKMKWMNYRTGVKDVYFRLEADHKTAKICIDIQHSDDGIRALFYEQFGELKRILHDTIGKELIWLPEYVHETGKKSSRIYAEIDADVNIYQREHWPAMFEFFEQYIVPMDEFWNEFKDIFIELQK
jgi:hypothetical protein